MRPTREQVEAALEKDADPGFNPSKHHRALAAEVRALREELEQLGVAARQTGDYRSLAAMRAEIITRVQAVADDLRADATGQSIYAADEIERALRGEP